MLRTFESALEYLQSEALFADAHELLYSSNDWLLRKGTTFLYSVVIYRGEPAHQPRWTNNPTVNHRKLNSGRADVTKTTCFVYPRNEGCVSDNFFQDPNNA